VIALQTADPSSRQRGETRPQFSDRKSPTKWARHLTDCQPQSDSGSGSVPRSGCYMGLAKKRMAGDLTFQPWIICVVYECHGDTSLFVRFLFSDCFCDHKVWLHSIGLMQPAMKLGAWPVVAFVIEPQHPKRRPVDPPLMEGSFIRRSRDYPGYLRCVRFRKAVLALKTRIIKVLRTRPRFEC
jgi:hypothetical protein